MQVVRGQYAHGLSLSLARPGPLGKLMRGVKRDFLNGNVAGIARDGRLWGVVDLSFNISFTVCGNLIVTDLY
jgi:hypothetical protein